MVFKNFFERIIEIYVQFGGKTVFLLYLATLMRCALVRSLAIQPREKFIPYSERRGGKELKILI